MKNQRGFESQHFYDDGMTKCCIQESSSCEPVSYTHLHWAEKQYKPMILNVARSKAIEKVAKSGYFEDWIGVKVQLYIEHGIKAFGDVVSAVRVRPYPPKIAKILCDDCKKEITPAGGMSAAEIAAYTKQKYSRTLCAACRCV